MLKKKECSVKNNEQSINVNGYRSFGKLSRDRMSQIEDEK